MTDALRTLTDAELDCVAGGTTPAMLVQSTIPLPHIPKDSQMLTPAQIAKILSVGGGFVPPMLHG